jgi:hypothetical protein
MIYQKMGMHGKPRLRPELRDGLRTTENGFLYPEEVAPGSSSRILEDCCGRTFR